MQVSRSSLTGALALPEQGALVAVVGGGGKSALLFALGAQLPGRVILTTTTRIFAVQIARAVASCETLSDLGGQHLETQLRDGPSGLLIVGHVDGDKAMGVDPSLPGRWFRRADVRHVIVEADGSRMRPIKAPGDHEPVIAEGTTDVVIAIGIDALGEPLGKCAHRPQRVCALLDLPKDAADDHVLTEDDIAALATHPRGGLKEVPQGARVVVMINKVESEEQQQQAMRIAERIICEPRIDRVIIGALEGARPHDWILVRKDVR